MRRNRIQMFSSILRIKIRQMSISYQSNRFTGMQQLLKQKAFVNGEWVDSINGKVFQVLNPANGKVIATVPDLDSSDTKIAIQAASKAFTTWQKTTAIERAHLLRNLYDLIIKNKDSLASIITSEAGKTLKESCAEVDYSASYIEWFSEEARRINGEILQSPIKSKKFLVDRYPIGVVGLITPWNFPLAMIARKLGAALAAGCTCIIKPAQDTPLTALALSELSKLADFPKGVINVLTSGQQNSIEVGKLLCTSPQVSGISFTGSTAIGKILYKQCAQSVKRLGLELGGNAPFIVYDSANVDNAVKGAMVSKFRNCGQTCVATNRILVQEGVYERFLRGLVEEVRQLKLGDGSDPSVTLGPLINNIQANKVHDLVSDAVSKGATVLIGGKPVPAVGDSFYEPTILTNIKENMLVYTEEVFGPVATIITFKTEEESLHIANETNSGLAAYFYSEDIAQIFRVSRELQFGMVGVNEGAISSTEIPFGGIKESGLGREGSQHGTEDFTYYKYTCLGNL